MQPEKPFDASRTTITLKRSDFERMLDHHAAVVHAVRVNAFIDETYTIETALNGQRKCLTLQLVAYDAYGGDPVLVVLRNDGSDEGMRGGEQQHYYVLTAPILAKLDKAAPGTDEVTDEISVLSGELGMHLVMTPFGFDQAEDVD